MINKADNSTTDKRIDKLRELLHNDLLGQDVKWSLFVGAAKTFKYDSCLKPFPPEYLTEFGEKNINRLIETVDKVPALQQLLLTLDKPGTSTCDPEVIELLYFVLVQLKDYNVTSIKDAKEIKEIMCKVPPSTKFTFPTHIFKIIATDTSEEKFQSHAARYATGYAYHGSKIENFYSILNYGLQQHLNKTSLYGEGVYLSTEINVSILFSPLCSIWKNSIFGLNASGIVLCEYVDHPVYLTRHEKAETTPQGQFVSKKRKEIPEKYLLITNNEIVQVRYLLVYGDRKRRNQSAMGQTWLQKNKSVALILLYATVLIAVGFSQSPTTFLFKEFLVHKISNACNFIKNMFYVN